MWRFLLVFMASALFISCGSNGSDVQLQIPVEKSLAYRFEGVDAPTPETAKEDNYPGKTIDQIFPIQFEKSLGVQADIKNFVTSKVDEFEFKTKGFSPNSLYRNKKEIFRFRPHTPNDYWSSLAGTASLLGQGSKQIYVVATGPGAVCCTNYWIVDVAAKKPRLIFSSEAHGRFRDAMEIFDADTDGVYELVQYDSCFRYFMDDCGSCSPEPRVVFKYNNLLNKYVPAPGLMQDFVKDAMLAEDRSIKEKYAEWRNNKDEGLKYDLGKSVLDHAVQLMHLGKERDGWHFLKTYDPSFNKKLEKEVRWRLKDCQFFKNLPKIN